MIEAEKGSYPLIAAAGNGHTDVARYLLEAGVDKEAPNDLGNRPLMCAAQEGHLGAVEVLLDAGAQVDAENADVCSELIAAADRGHVQVYIETQLVLLSSGLPRGIKTYGQNVRSLVRFRISLIHCPVGARGHHPLVLE